MDAASQFNNNFRSFLQMIASAPHGASLHFKDGSLAAASGEPSAGENYVIFNEEARPKDVAEAKAFFEKRGASFIAPWLPSTPYELAEAFQENGLLRRRIYTSMYLPRENMTPLDGVGCFEDISGAQRSDWAEALWLAFGGDGADAKGIAGYRSFGEYLAQASGNRALVLRDEGRIVTTALLHETAETMGLYYFATLPEHRKRGHAGRLLEALGGLSLKADKELCLLATEEGFKLYISHGFKMIDKIAIYSTSADI